MRVAANWSRLTLFPGPGPKLFFDNLILSFVSARPRRWFIRVPVQVYLFLQGLSLPRRNKNNLSVQMII